MHVVGEGYTRPIEAHISYLIPEIEETKRAGRRNQPRHKVNLTRPNMLLPPEVSLKFAHKRT